MTGPTNNYGTAGNAGAPDLAAYETLELTTPPPTAAPQQPPPPPRGRPLEDLLLQRDRHPCFDSNQVPLRLRRVPRLPPVTPDTEVDRILSFGRVGAFLNNSVTNLPPGLPLVKPDVQLTTDEDLEPTPSPNITPTSPPLPPRGGRKRQKDLPPSDAKRVQLSAGPPASDELQLPPRRLERNLQQFWVNSGNRTSLSDDEISKEFRKYGNQQGSFLTCNQEPGSFSLAYVTPARNVKVERLSLITQDQVPGVIDEQGRFFSSSEELSKSLQLKLPLARCQPLDEESQQRIAQGFASHSVGMFSQHYKFDTLKLPSYPKNPEKSVLPQGLTEPVPQWPNPSSQDMKPSLQRIGSIASVHLNSAFHVVKRS